MLTREATDTRVRIPIQAHSRVPSVLTLVGLAASALGALALAIEPGETRLLLLLAFVVVGPGAAIVCHARLRNGLAASALTITASLTSIGLVTAVTFWLDSWHPLAVHLGMLAASAASLFTRLAVDWTGRPRSLASYTPAETLPAREPEVRRAWPTAIRFLPPLMVGVGLALWLWSMWGFDPSTVGGFGLTIALGWPFISALVLVCGAFIVELLTASRTAILAAALAAFLLLSRATASLLLHFPEYAWTFKHLGVVELISQNGHITDPEDIYQLWPAFFTSAAHVTALAGLDPIAYATWSPLFFSTVDAILVGALCRALTSDKRILFLTVFIFTGAAWPVTNYFSPQAFGFALMLGFYLIVLLWLRPASRRMPERGSRILGKLRNVLLRGGQPLGPEPTRSPSRAAMAAACAVFLVITAAHQLSPYLMLVPLAVLALLRLIRPRYLVLVLGIIAVGYTMLRLPNVASAYTIFTGINPFVNGAGNAPNGWATPGQVFSSIAVRATCFGLWGTALFAALMSRKQLGRIVLPLTLVFAPFTLMAVTSYGGEVVYRVYAFSLPMCALLGATLWLGIARNPLRSALISTTTLSVFCFAAMQGVQGQFGLDKVPNSEIMAAEHLYATAPPGSVVLLAAPNFPTRLNGNYDSFNRGTTGRDPSLLDQPRFHNARFGQDSIPAVTEWAEGFNGTSRYLIVSKQMKTSTHYFGLLPSGSLEGLSRGLRASPHWVVFYHEGGTTIFQLRPRG